MSLSSPRSTDHAHRKTDLPVGSGAQAYNAALSRAGGSEMESLLRSGDEAALCVGLYHSPAYDLWVPPLTVSRLSVNLSSTLATGALDGDREQTFQPPRHSVYLTPAGAAAHWRKDRPSRHLNLYFHRSTCTGDAPGDSPLDEPTARRINAAFGRALPGIGAIAQALAAELEAPDAFTVEAVDSLARLLLVRLARLQARQARAGNPLSPQMLQRVKDHVQASLSERILVGHLAGVAGLPVNRFAQAFSQHTGLSPHQFVLAQRLQLAAALLARSRMGLAEIAAHCGFSSQQHLTNTMRRRLGVTPARLRGQSEAGGRPQPAGA